MQNYISVYVGDDIAQIEIKVALADDFKSNLGTNLENFGWIEISHVNKSTEHLGRVFWDNINFFIQSPKSELNKECQQELEFKGLYYKGIYKDIKRGLEDLVKAGYLKK